MEPEEIELIRAVLNSSAVQNLIGAEEWALSEQEEERLWRLIDKLNKETFDGPV